MVCVLQVDYFNNKVICDLVEASHTGIMAQLDEACYMVGKVDDTLFLDALSNKLAAHKHFTSRKVAPLGFYFFSLLLGPLQASEVLR